MSPPSVRCQACYRRHERCARSETDGEPCERCASRGEKCLPRSLDAEQRPLVKRKRLPMSSSTAVSKAAGQEALPDDAAEHSELLTQLHHAASVYYGASRGRRKALKSLDGTALAALGILLEEAMREAIEDA